MNATVAAPDLRLLAPAFAGRFALIIAGLLALIARAFLHDSKLAPLIVPLYRCLNRTARGITTLMARLAAGRRAARRSDDACGGGRQRSRTPKPLIPTTHAWLIHTLRHEAAGYASQLSHLLNEPGVPELLAATPTAGRLLRPLCRMLGLPATARRAVASNPAAETQLCVPKAAGCASSRTESPDAPPRTVAPQATGFFDFKNLGSPTAPRPPPKTPPPTGIGQTTAPPHPPPPCPHVRWPWFTRAQAKPT